MRRLISTTLLLTFAAACGSEGMGAGDDEGGLFEGEGSGGGGGGGGGGMSDVGEEGGPDPEDTDTLPTYPAQHPRIYLGPNKARLQAALTANGAPAARFKAKVDQWLSGASVYNFSAWNGALMSQLTGNPAYCTKAIGIVEAEVVAAEAAIASNQRPVVAHDSYLHIGERIGDLALVYDWCHDAVTATQKQRWIAYANRAVANVWDHQNARWGSTVHPWSGWSVNNPSNNYYYSFLRATMLLGLATKDENPEADGWITKFRDDKILGELVPAFNADLVGGGSREGTGYGVAMRNLFELYDWWHATTGEKLATKTTHTRASLISFMHQTMPTLDRVAPTGDHARDATAVYFDYHRAYLQVLSSLFPNDPMAGRAQTLLAGSSVQSMSQPFMYIYDFLYDGSQITAQPLSGMANAYYARGIGQVYARSGWDTHATWVNLTGGPYTESHAHQDQGSLMIYKDGWLAEDANLHSKSGLAQAASSNNVVRISQGGTAIRQIATTMSNVEALNEGQGWLHAAVDVTPAYNNNAAVQKVQREMVYFAPDVVVVYDRVQTASGTTQTWQLATPTAAAISGNTATVTGTGHQLAVTKVKGGAMSTYSFASEADFKGGFRLDETQPGGDHRYLHVLAVDNAATAITPVGDNGVRVTLPGGKIAEVTFERDTIGATLTLDGNSENLAAGVSSLPQ